MEMTFELIPESYLYFLSVHVLLLLFYWILSPRVNGETRLLKLNTIKV